MYVYPALKPRRRLFVATPRQSARAARPGRHLVVQRQHSDKERGAAAMALFGTVVPSRASLIRGKRGEVASRVLGHRSSIARLSPLLTVFRRATDPGCLVGLIRFYLKVEHKRSQTGPMAPPLPRCEIASTRDDDHTHGFQGRYSAATPERDARGASQLPRRPSAVWCGTNHARRYTVPQHFVASLGRW
jgi:hypothetical protein